MFIFSFATTFGMYYINEIYNQPAITHNWGLSRVQALVNSTSSLQNLNGGQSPNPALVFGDFLIGVTVLFNLLGTIAVAGFAGGGLAAVLSGFPGFSIEMQWITMIIYGSSSACLWIYIISFRSV